MKINADNNFQNGVASFIGPLIASKFFFSGANQNNLTNVQFVYLAVACAGVAVAILFALSKLPEVAESAVRSASVVSVTDDIEAVDQYGHTAGQGPIYRQYNMVSFFLSSKLHSASLLKHCRSSVSSHNSATSVHRSLSPASSSTT